MTITDILITALVGFLVVFVVLVVLMCAIKFMAFIFEKLDKKPAASEVKEEDKADIPAAPGSCGDLTLKNVSDKDAAMIMAIVADKLETPLNELRFISIKEVEEV